MRTKNGSAPLWADNTDVSKILYLMQQMVELPKQQRMPCLMLIGDVGSGKTSILQHLCKNLGSPYICDAGYYNAPIRLIEAPLLGDEKQLYMSLLASLRLRYRVKDSKIKLRRQAIYELREARVRLLLVDDVDRVLEGSNKQQELFMSVIRYLSNELMLSIVLCGTKDCVKLLSLHPQHESRFDVAELHVKGR